MWLVANEARTAKGGPYIYYYKPSSDLKLIALEEVRRLRRIVIGVKLPSA